MPTHPMARVRFESVACLNPLLDESLLVVDPQAWFAARTWLTEAGGDALVEALLRAPAYAREEGLPYTVLMETPLTPARAREAVGWARGEIVCKPPP
jgi:hypothetical protein